MKKYLFSIVTASAFIGFVAYATIETRPISEEKQAQEEIVLLEDSKNKENEELPSFIFPSTNGNLTQSSFVEENTVIAPEPEQITPGTVDVVTNKEIEQKVSKDYDDEEYSDDRDDDEDDDD